MLDDTNTIEGIRISDIGSNIYVHREGADLRVTFTVRIIDEDTDVAEEDAQTMRDIITTLVRDFVKDYASDGQEVE